MSQFMKNSVEFAADCACHDGQCTVARENFLFLDDGKELSAVDVLQMKCGRVVVIPDNSCEGNALLYHTSCPRMNDVVDQIFPDCLERPVRLPQAHSEMTVGELHRRRVGISYLDCRMRVEGFDFPRPSAN